MGSCLIVEDDELFALLLQRIVAPHATTIVIVHSGENAILQLQSHDFDAILLDMRLRGSDGGAVMNYVDRFKPDARPKIIVVTSFPVIGRAWAPGVPVVDKGDVLDVAALVAALIAAGEET